MLTLYEVIIRPQSLFGTPLAGDTLFGHLCWQFALDATLLTRPFADCVRAYAVRPFLVISSAFPRIRRDQTEGYALPCPDLSLFADKIDKIPLHEKLARRKTMKKNKWFFVGQKLLPHFEKNTLMDAEKVAEGIRALHGEVCLGDPAFQQEVERSHNSINRLTGTTGEGNFAPFTTDAFSFLPRTTLAVFVLADTNVCPSKSLHTAFDRVGTFGYGRDASTGLGRFSVEDLRKRELPQNPQANACYTLAPCVPPQPHATLKVWAKPLTRFGKHGGIPEPRPFKAPVVMAEAGAVFQLDTLPQNGFWGSGVTGVSKARPETIVQGYAPILPCTVKEA